MKGLQPKVHTVLYIVSAKVSHAEGEKRYKGLRAFVLFVITNDNPYCLISALFLFGFPCFFYSFSGRLAIMDLFQYLVSKAASCCQSIKNN